MTSVEFNASHSNTRWLCQLAAVRAGEVLGDPGKEWLHWGLTHLGKFEELILSDTFYKSLGKKPAASLASAPAGLENSGLEGWGAWKLASYGSQVAAVQS